MDEQINVQRHLTEKFAQLRAKNPGYSLRSFARKIAVSPGALSALMQGKRRLSLKLATRIADKLCLDPAERSALLAPFEHVRSAKKKTQAPINTTHATLDMDHYRVISEWQHFALLSLILTEDFRNEPTWIAKRLGLHPSAIKAALSRLNRLGMIEKDSAGRLRRTATQYITSDDIKNASLRLSHRQNLELGLKSLEEDDVDVRDFTAVTMAIDPSRIGKAKARIRNVLRELSTDLELGSPSEVYKLCIQLYPVTKVSPKKQEKK